MLPKIDPNISQYTLSEVTRVAKNVRQLLTDEDENDDHDYSIQGLTYVELSRSPFKSQENTHETRTETLSTESTLAKLTTANDIMPNQHKFDISESEVKYYLNDCDQLNKLKRSRSEPLSAIKALIRTSHRLRGHQIEKDKTLSIEQKINKYPELLDERMI
ncbi:unnamed protein product [Didymodactylos carnosus]|uniref:Uncharacterized protein n=1 Tax=Didymodactylos carnosus TaxID=1234261 RepID=A0A813XXK4_9BILA|nr:unnamed protein product [Didymodactylos carnosus]CAF3663948.1 unnamed protein product [Didymodactylos carnosus]